jgi:hypothetical protein
MGRAPFRSISLKGIGQIKRNWTKFSESEGLRPSPYLATVNVWFWAQSGQSPRRGPESAIASF